MLSPLVAMTDAARAKRFYESVLGLVFHHEEPTALVFTANGATLRLSKVETIAASAPSPVARRSRDLKTPTEMCFR